MPDILIRGMEMPKTCSQCPMCYDYMMCKLNKFAFWNTNEPFDCCDERLAGCPLHELPEHGDLISRDELLKSLRESVDACHKWIDEMRATDNERMVEIAQQSHSTFIEAILRVKAMPVIVPASEEVADENP